MRRRGPHAYDDGTGGVFVPRPPLLTVSVTHDQIDGVVFISRNSLRTCKSEGGNTRDDSTSVLTERVAGFSDDARFSFEPEINISSPIPQFHSDRRLKKLGFQPIHIIVWGEKIVVWLDPTNPNIPCLVTGLSTHYAPVLRGEFASFAAIASPLFVNGVFEARCKIKIPTLERLSEFYEAVRQRLEGLYGARFSKIAVFGHSAMGACAMHYARTHPDRVHFLQVVCSPTVFNLPEAVRMSREFYAARFESAAEKSLSPVDEAAALSPDELMWLRRRHLPGVREYRFPISVVPGGSQKQLVTEYKAKHHMNFRRYWDSRLDDFVEESFACGIWNMRFLQYFYDKMLQPRREENVVTYDFSFFFLQGARLRAPFPVIFLLGWYDSLVVPGHMDLLMRYLGTIPSTISPFATVQVLNCGHWPMWEAPREMMELTKAGLAKAGFFSLPRALPRIADVALPEGSTVASRADQTAEQEAASAAGAGANAVSPPVALGRR